MVVKAMLECAILFITINLDNFMDFKLPSSSKVVVGLSGGVDSAVAALELKKAGHDVIGLFMKNWDEDDTDTYCSAETDLKDARQICKKMNIPLKTINFSHEYWKHVFSHFLEAYEKGYTPNPDILCNKEIKFKYFLEHALKLGADFIATGHYARRVSHPYDDNKWSLAKACDLNKDQTYFLNAINQAQISHSVFPLGHLQKAEVRRRAKEAGFENFAKKDSTGICFIGEKKFNDFLNEYLISTPGEIHTPEGHYLGAHQGLLFYTLGQRKGIQLGGLKQFDEKPWYVVGKDIEKNILYVSQDIHHPWQFSHQLLAHSVNWSAPPPCSLFQCFAKVRYRQPDQSCQVKVIDNQQVLVTFDMPQRAVTPGQSVVIYDAYGHCLGGGVIAMTNSKGGLISQTCNQSHLISYEGALNGL